MRKAVLTIAVSGFALNGFSQTTLPYSKATLEVNNIRSSINTLGSMWYDPTTGVADCEYPKGSGKHAGYAGGFWIGGYDTLGILKTAAVTYNTNGKRDYFPGILSAAGTSDTAVSRLWQRIWNIRKTTIDSFRAIVRTVGTVNPTALDAALNGAGFEDLKAWPAKGSTTIKGNNNAPISLAATPYRKYAPFVDVDGDGQYNYLRGDYPLIKGDQMLWMVFNDMGGPKTETGSAGIGLEIHLSAYAYVRSTIADNIQFYEYKLHNYGFQKLDSARVSIWTDMDLGYAYDDYIGFDSAHRMGYMYNAKAIDGSGGLGHYGANPPVSGIVLLRTEGDIGTNRLPTGGFTYFSQGAGVPAAITDPQTSLEFYRYMSGTNKFGQPFTNDFTGACNVQTMGYGSGPATKTVWTDDPNLQPGWSECCSGNPPGDRRFILSSPPFTLNPDIEKEIAFAVVIASNGGGCPNTDLTGLQATADTAFQLYDHPVYATAVENVSVFPNLTLFPNPAKTELTVSNLPSANTSVRVYDLTGKMVALPFLRRGNDLVLNTNSLSSGVYALQITDGENTEVRRFVKE